MHGWWMAKCRIRNAVDDITGVYRSQNLKQHFDDPRIPRLHRQLFVVRASCQQILEDPGPTNSRAFYLRWAITHGPSDSAQLCSAQHHETLGFMTLQQSNWSSWLSWLERWSHSVYDLVEYHQEIQSKGREFESLRGQIHCFCRFQACFPSLLSLSLSFS